MYLEKFKLGGRIAVVTGAGQGIGLACAEALGEAGAKVIIADFDPKAAETLNGRVHACWLNPGLPPTPQEAAAQAPAAAGGTTSR